MRSTVSVREVAQLAGVSVGTVSNVLNRPAMVAPATRDRVLAAIAELGFVPNESARHLRSGTARAIGLLVLDVSNPFFTDVARGVEEVATEAGHVVILCNSDGSEAKQAKHLDLLSQQRVHGVLITPASRSLDQVRGLRDRGISVVLLDHHTEETGTCSVAVDDLTGGELAITHLLAGGHEHIAMITGSAGIFQAEQRRAGAQAALRRAGRPPEVLELIEVPSLTVASGLRVGEQLLARSRRPTAVFCVNDLLALGVLQVMVRGGVAVPEEMAIVGYDDIDFAAAAAVPLTSVRQPRRLIGRTAAELVIGETADPEDHQHQHIVFTPELVVRDSSRRMRGPRSPVDDVKATAVTGA